MDPEYAVERLPDHVSPPKQQQARRKAPDADETIEERCFSASLSCLEGHYTQAPPMGPKTTAKVNSMIAKTLEKTHTCRKSRYDHKPVSRDSFTNNWFPEKPSQGMSPSGYG